MSADYIFTKDNLDLCFSRLAKEYRKTYGTKVSAEIVLIGGAAVLVNYGFRDMTYDIDAMIRAASSMKEIINKVGDELRLPNGWLNSDFVKTKSYSPKLVQYSKFYKRFGHVLNVRTVTGEYLIAMKLMSGRQYKNDMSDIIGILHEEKENGRNIDIDMIKAAVCDLYGSWEQVPETSQVLLAEILKDGQTEKLYHTYRRNEKRTKESVIVFQEKYPGVANADNINDIIKGLKNRRNQNGT